MPTIRKVFNNPTTSIPDNGCVYRAVEDLLGREINDEAWKAHLIANTGTLAFYYSIIANRYDLVLVNQAVLWFDQRFKYGEIQLVDEVWYYDHNAPMIITFYTKKSKTGWFAHAVCVPYHAACWYKRAANYMFDPKYIVHKETRKSVSRNA